jgi:hypothetical protein
VKITTGKNFFISSRIFPPNWTEVLPSVGNTAYSHHNSLVTPHPSSPLVPLHCKTFPFLATLLFSFLFILSPFPFLSYPYPLSSLSHTLSPIIFFTNCYSPFPLPHILPQLLLSHLDPLASLPSLISSFPPLIILPFRPSNNSPAFSHLLPLIPLLSSLSPHSCPLIPISLSKSFSSL